MRSAVQYVYVVWPFNCALSPHYHACQWFYLWQSFHLWQSEDSMHGNVMAWQSFSMSDNALCNSVAMAGLMHIVTFVFTKGKIV